MTVEVKDQEDSSFLSAARTHRFAPTCTWGLRSRKCADQEWSEGKDHPAPSSFPSLLSRTLSSLLIPFPHNFRPDVNRIATSSGGAVRPPCVHT